MKIHDSFDQHSLEWFEIRAGKVTASELDRLVTPLGKVKAGDGPHTYMLQKLAEKWTGQPLPSDASSFAMEQGGILEDHARPAFTWETGFEIRQVGFIETDSGLCGCSPDSILQGKEIGLEIKAPGVVNHIRYLLDGGLPEDYTLQVQGCLYVTGWAQWMFMSFRRHMAPLIITVERDAKIQAAISEAMQRFNDELAAGWETLLKLNGPPPPRQQHLRSPGKPLFSWEQTSQMPS